MSWKEMQVVFDNLSSALEAMQRADGGTTEHSETLSRAVPVLLELHELWKPVTRLLKVVTQDHSSDPELE
jgi:hypothetical protein